MFFYKDDRTYWQPILWIICLNLLLLFGLTTSVFATAKDINQYPNIIEVSSQTIESSSTFEVSVTAQLDPAPDVLPALIQASVAYSATKLLPLRCQMNDDIPGFTDCNISAEGAVEFDILDHNGITETLPLATISFKEISTNTTSEIHTLGLEVVEFRDMSAETVPIISKNGVITTTSPCSIHNSTFVDDAYSDPGADSVHISVPTEAIVSVTTTNESNGDYNFSPIDLEQEYVVEFAPTTTFTITDSVEDVIDYIDTSPCLGVISGRVWEDNNYNGIQDVGELGIEGVSVSLTDKAGSVLMESTTDANGHYSFTDLEPLESYLIQVKQPAGAVFTTQDVGDNDNIDSDVNQDGWTVLIHITANGGHFTNIDAGTVNPDQGSLDCGGGNVSSSSMTTINLTGTVSWIDPNNNGNVTCAEVKCECLDGPNQGNFITAATDINGKYTFAGRIPAYSSSSMHGISVKLPNPPSFSLIRNIPITNVDMTEDILIPLPLTPNCQVGDVNCNGIPDSLDSLLILKYVIGKAAGISRCPPDGCKNTLCLSGCDVNEDGKCDLVDALFILQCEVGIHNPFCPMNKFIILNLGDDNTASSASVTFGDVNADGAYTAVDALHILRDEVGITPMPVSEPGRSGAGSQEEIDAWCADIGAFDHNDSDVSGDFDGDGDCDGDDYGAYVCDVSGDNQCNSIDALFILQCDVGLSNDFCAQP